MLKWVGNYVRVWVFGQLQIKRHIFFVVNLYKKCAKIGFSCTDINFTRNAIGMAITTNTNHICFCLFAQECFHTELPSSLEAKQIQINYKPRFAINDFPAISILTLRRIVESNKNSFAYPWKKITRK